MELFDYGSPTHMGPSASVRKHVLPICTSSSHGSVIHAIMTLLPEGALKLLAEAFPWQTGSMFAYTVDNHNSVVGIREEALAAGASAAAVTPCGTSTGEALL